MSEVSKPTANRRHVLGGVGAVAGLVAMPFVARAQAPIIMKMGTPTINDNQHEWMKMFAASVEAGSKGAIKAEIYPASQLGAAPRMIEGAQLGTVQVIVLPPEFVAGVDSRYEVLGAPGLFKDIAHGQRCLQSPAFNKAFLSIGESKGLKGVGLFVTAQMIINCRTKLGGVAEVAGKKVRVLGSAMQLEQVKRMKGTGIPQASTLVEESVTRFSGLGSTSPNGRSENTQAFLRRAASASQPKQRSKILRHRPHR
jgi:TRAP-type C4-dicarboxylate transport system substrate-binding protein